MTVIFFRDGVMAADSADWIGDVVYTFDRKKVERLSDGSLLGACCEASDIQDFHAWARGGFKDAERPTDMVDGFGAVLAKPDGTIWSYDHRLRAERVYGDWYGCGAHQEFMSALAVAGKSAVEAVALAIKHCAWAAGEVYSLSLDRPADEAAPEPEDDGIREWPEPPPLMADREAGNGGKSWRELHGLE